MIETLFHTIEQKLTCFCEVVRRGWMERVNILRMVGGGRKCGEPRISRLDYVKKVTGTDILEVQETSRYMPRWRYFVMKITRGC